MCSLLTIIAVTPDPKKRDYIALRYQAKRDGPIDELYFKVDKKEWWVECVHTLIEICRKHKILQKQSKEQV